MPSAIYCGRCPLPRLLHVLSPSSVRVFCLIRGEPESEFPFRNTLLLHLCIRPRCRSRCCLQLRLLASTRNSYFATRNSLFRIQSVVDFVSVPSVIPCGQFRLQRFLRALVSSLFHCLPPSSFRIPIYELLSSSFSTRCLAVPPASPTG